MNVQILGLDTRKAGGFETRRKGQASALFSAKEEVPRSAQMGKKPGNGERGKLRPEREMDNFFCSHRCLLTEVMLVRGALGASNTGASRYVTWLFLPSCSFGLDPRENELFCIS